jgi:hypothetical protein
MINPKLAWLDIQHYITTTLWVREHEILGSMTWHGRKDKGREGLEPFTYPLKP